ncbi:MAG TPA: POTRA domain-containing protein, partial [Gemmatimonadaceae bacterium]
MHRTWLSGLALLVASASASAQEPAPQAGLCATPDTLLVIGNQRVNDAAVRAQVGFTPGRTMSVPDLQRAIRALYETGQFADVRFACVVHGGGRSALQLTVREHPLVGQIQVQGTDQVSEKTVRDRITISTGAPVNPAMVAQSAAAIDSVYEAKGLYLSRVDVDSAAVGDTVNLTFRVTEGGRIAISGVEIVGNQRVSGDELVGAMDAKPEGFWWFRPGKFDQTELAADIGQRLPALYASRGFIDAVVMQDTVMIDRRRGKALVRLTVDEGPQYRVGRFDVVGNQRFSTEDVRAYYPFGDTGPTLSERVTDLLLRRHREAGVFDQAEWDDATSKLLEAYSNEGYIFANVTPVVERTAVGPDS